jgi:thiol-disulfide isomerase/thioredoxin
LNTQPLTIEGLKGKVVLLDFSTFDCVNCIRTLPHIRQLHTTYAGDSFILISVHTPEFEFEKDPENLAVPNINQFLRCKREHKMGTRNKNEQHINHPSSRQSRNTHYNRPSQNSDRDHRRENYRSSRHLSNPTDSAKRSVASSPITTII